MSIVLFWVLIAWWLFEVVVVVSVIGQPRKPVTPKSALFVITTNVTLIAALLIWGGVR